MNYQPRLTGWKEQGINWEAIKGAVKTVATGDPVKIESHDYKVYRVGETIRIDLNPEAIKEEMSSDNQQVAEGRAQQEQGHEEHGAV